MVNFCLVVVRANAVTQAKGSAYIETGKTKIICSM
jgi:ribonuclease PH